MLKHITPALVAASALLAVTPGLAATYLPKLPLRGLAGSGGSGAVPAPGSSAPAAQSSPAPAPAGPWADSPTLTVERSLKAVLNSADAISVTFQNTTSRNLRVSHVPVGALGYPFTSQAESGCPVGGGLMAPGATCKLLVRFSPCDGAVGTYQDAQHLFFRWQFDACVQGPCGDPAASGHVTRGALVGEAAAAPGPVNLVFDRTGALGQLAGKPVVTKYATLTNTGANFFQLNSFRMASDSSQGQIRSLNASACRGGLHGGESCLVSYVVDVADWAAPGTYRATFSANGADATANNWNVVARFEVSFSK